MIFVTLSGRRQEVNVSPFRIDWEAKSLSKFQWGVKQFLQPYWDGKVVCEEFPVTGTRMHVDLINISDKVAIEVNGAQHDGVSKFFHNNSMANYKAQIKRDFRKAEWCEKNGFVLVEIVPTDLPLSAKWFEDKYAVIL